MRTIAPLLALLVTMSLACNTSDQGATCTSDQSRECTCPNTSNHLGTQVCSEEGSWGQCEGCPTVNPCDEVTCSNHGECVEVDGSATCDCDDGFLLDGMECVEDPNCVPNCTDKRCGPNGCGGDCGVCNPSQICEEGQCVCAPNCEGKVCGDDGCGGTCGTCQGYETCTNGQCSICQTQCNGKACGDDGCGGFCGSCPEGKECGDDGLCHCAPQCEGRECGDDGCGGTCGSCLDDESCTEGLCVQCQPHCQGRECGEDGCGGSCGECVVGEICIDAICQSTGASCAGNCGGGNEECYCDDFCFESGDCCVDVCTACPFTVGCGEELCEPGYLVDCLGNCSHENDLGNGVCDDAFFCASFDWDYYDCEPQCGAGEALDCSGYCSSTSYLGDGWCDYGFNCEEFNFDNGDCGNGTGTCENMCGIYSGMCYCDEYCFSAGDCCDDVCDFCTNLEACGCVPSCEDKQCGTNGCTGTCGYCDSGFGCDEELGVCVEGLCPEGQIMDCDGYCALKEYWGNGTCDEGYYWFDTPASEAPSDPYYSGANFNCEELQWDNGDCEPCYPDCDGKECGFDGCFGNCGECNLGSGCNPEQQCEEEYCDVDYVMDCDGICSWEGAIGDGWCDTGTYYDDDIPYAASDAEAPIAYGNNFACEKHDWDGGDCEPCIGNCEGLECGSDGCYGWCGYCGDGLACVAGMCTEPLTCSKILACFTECIPLGEDCEMNCIDNASYVAQNLFYQLAICATEQGVEECEATDVVCFQATLDACPTEQEACLAN